jgi:hypothetical protein
MKHSYRFLLGADEEIGYIESEGAMPHLQKGVRIDLESDEYHRTRKTHFEIQDISVILHQIGGQVVRNEIRLHCSEVEGMAE